MKIAWSLLNKIRLNTKMVFVCFFFFVLLPSENTSNANANHLVLCTTITIVGHALTRSIEREKKRREAINNASSRCINLFDRKHVKRVAILSTHCHQISKWYVRLLTMFSSFRFPKKCLRLCLLPISNKYCIQHHRNMMTFLIATMFLLNFDQQRLNNDECHCVIFIIEFPFFRIYQRWISLVMPTHIL